MSLFQFHRSAIDQALKSKNGHLDLFLRFLLGISLDSNKGLLNGVLTQTESSTQSIEKTAEYIKELERCSASPERIINLLHCLIELKHNSLVKDAKKYLDSSSEVHLTPALCSALAYVLLASDTVLDVFDTSKYTPSEEGCIRLLPAVRCCRTAVVSGCNLSFESGNTLVSVLQSTDSHLTKLDLSYCDLRDSTLSQLCSGLKSPHCKLETLSLAGCNLTQGCCSGLASLLKLPHSKLMNLDLRDNSLQDEGVKLLSIGLEDPNCTLQRLGISGCQVTKTGYAFLASALRSNPSHLRELDLSYNHPGDSGIKLLCDVMKDSSCKLEKLELSGCNLTMRCCTALASVLKLDHSKLIDLELRDNDLQDDGMILLSAGLKNHNCRLQRLGVSFCNITGEGCASLASAMRSILRELDVSDHQPGHPAIKLQYTLLQILISQLEMLKQGGCDLLMGCCTYLALFLSPYSLLMDLRPGDSEPQIYMTLLSNNRKHFSCPMEILGMNYYYLRSACLEYLEERYLCCSHAGDSRVRDLFYVLKNPSSKLEHGGYNHVLLCCADLASFLKSLDSVLIELELRDRGMEKTHVILLSGVVEDPRSTLRRLRLLYTDIKEIHRASLASALSVSLSSENLSHLRELDLSYNHPGDSGVKLLSAILEDPSYKLEKLDVDHGGECRIKPGLLKYACQLTMDSNTAHRHLSLSDGNRKVTRTIDEQPYPDHPERFDDTIKVMCTEGLCSRSYWETEWTGPVGVVIGVTYKGISRKGQGSDCKLGFNNKSWSLYCTEMSYSTMHRTKSTKILLPPIPITEMHQNTNSPKLRFYRVGVYVDWVSGTLSFYRVSSGKRTHLHTFRTTFNEPLYPVFVAGTNSSLSICMLG